MERNIVRAQQLHTAALFSIWSHVPPQPISIKYHIPFRGISGSAPGSDSPEVIEAVCELYEMYEECEVQVAQHLRSNTPRDIGPANLSAGCGVTERGCECTASLPPLSPKRPDGAGSLVIYIDAAIVAFNKIHHGHSP